MILFSLTTSVNAQPYKIIISKNPSFENWSNELPDDWILNYNAITTSITQSSDADTGDYALGITVDSSSFELISISQNVTAMPNTTYRFSIAFKGTFVVDSKIYFEWGWFNSSGLLIREEIEPSKMVVNQNATFSEFFGYIQYPLSPENTTSLILTLNLLTYEATAIFDDFVVSYESDDPSVISSPTSTTRTVVQSENDTSSSEITDEKQPDNSPLNFTLNLPILFVSLLYIRLIRRKIL